ncbi:hypothetical protein SAMN00120144_3315 [Hymenobacter roseosalivarius DSM 11622]|uniref:Uncharacterized protein n=1 Tax=Hymenobacter roseosalivarius DSM 11622 TaxID=645990 RepID=A0A1W1VHN8_9BACT|nr:hypothetical protein SAMN00120144_3315 [Hymenobacter roseosalivarius DSM 11622]
MIFFDYLVAISSQWTGETLLRGTEELKPGTKVVT